MGFGFGTTNSSLFEIGEMGTPGTQQDLAKLLAIDRGLAFQAGKTVHWRALARTVWTNQSIVEFYVDDVMTLPFTLPSPITGVFAGFGGAEITSAYRLSLPQA